MERRPDHSDDRPLPSIENRKPKSKPLTLNYQFFRAKRYIQSYHGLVIPPNR